MTENSIDAVAVYLAAQDLEAALQEGDDAKVADAMIDIREHVPEPTSEQWAAKYAEVLESKEETMENARLSGRQLTEKDEFIDGLVARNTVLLKLARALGVREMATKLDFAAEDSPRTFALDVNGVEAQVILDAATMLWSDDRERRDDDKKPTSPQEDEENTVHAMNARWDAQLKAIKTFAGGARG